MNGKMKKINRIYQKLEYWHHTHSDRDCLSKMLAYIVKKAILGLLIIFLIGLLPFIVIIRLAELFREKIIVKFRLNSTRPAIRQMQRIEEFNKFAAMQGVLGKWGIDLAQTSAGTTAFQYVQNLNLNENILSKRLQRSIIRELGRLPDFSPLWIPKLVQWTQAAPCRLEKGSIDLAALAETNFDDLSLNSKVSGLLFASDGSFTAFAENLIKKTDDKVRQLAGLADKREEFAKLVEKLFLTLENIKGGRRRAFSKANRRFIRAYRQILAHPIYQYLKIDESQPLIALLHDFAAATWNDVFIMHEYKAVGKAIIDDGNLLEAIDEPFKDLSGILKASQRTVTQLHYHNDRLLPNVLYTIVHFWQVMGYLAGEGELMRSLPAMFGIHAYDSHGLLTNNPSIQSTSIWDGSHVHGRINNCYGGSPTIGDHTIAPEFEALLQAAENNLLATEGTRREYVPCRIIFNSLQNLTKFYGEGSRSLAIMRLNEAYPLSFSGMVLAKDSSLYLMRNEKDIVWKDAEQFGKVLEGQLMQGINALDKPNCAFYFGGPKDRWQNIFAIVLKHVNIHFPKPPQRVTDLQRKQLQAAYQDYVYAALIAVVECQNLGDLTQGGIVNPLITQIIACRENIDRGGMENTKYMLLRLPFMPEKKLTDDEKLEYLVGVMNCRSISVRDRAILKDRMVQALYFIDLISIENFNLALKDILEELNLTAKLNYYLADEQLQNSKF